jgi:hypothetical protein
MTTIEMQRVSLRGQEVFDLYQQPFVEDTDFADVVQTMDNIPPNAVYKMQFHDIERYVTRAKEFCEFTPFGSTEMTEREAQTYYVGIDKEICIQDLKNTVWMWATKNGIDREKIDGTIIGQVIQSDTQKQIDADRKMIMWFGKVGAEAERNAANGFWSYFIPQGVSAGNIINTTAFANRVLGAGEGKDLLEAVYQQSTDELKESMEETTFVENMCYYTTRPVYDRLWLDFANDVNGSVLGEVRLQENGRKQLYYRGIPVKIAPNWEKYAKKFYPASYTAGNNANLCILCHKETLLHLTDTASAEVESYYDLSTRKNRIIVRYAMGAQIIYPQLISTAYNH